MKWMLAALAASPAPQQSCELHIWPAFATGAQAAGWLSNLGIAGALQDYENNKDERLRSQANLIQALPPQKQAKVIDSMNLPAQLSLTRARVVFESKFIDGKTAKTSKERQSASEAGCYAELVVSRNTYKNSPLHGQTLSTELSFRDFRHGRLRTRSRTETVKLETDGGPFDDAVVEAAFKANVVSFVHRLRPVNSR